MSGKARASSLLGSNSWLTGFVIPAILVAIWYLTSFIVGPNYLPPLHDTVVRLWEGLQEGSILDDLWFSLRTTSYASVVILVVGIPTGYVLGARPFVSEVAEGPLVALYATPRIVLYPIILVVLGFGEPARMTYGILGGVFPVILFTAGAVRSLTVYDKMADSLLLSSAQRFRFIIVPGALGEVLAGFRFGFALTFLGVLVAEMFGAPRGSGYEIVAAALRQDHRTMLAYVLAVVLVALIANRLLLWLELKAGGKVPHAVYSTDEDLAAMSGI